MKFERLLECYPGIEEDILLEAKPAGKLVTTASEMIADSAGVEAILKGLTAKNENLKYAAIVWALPVRVDNKQYDTLRDATMALVAKEGADNLDATIWDRQLPGSFKDEAVKNLYGKLKRAAENSRKNRETLTSGAKALNNTHLAKYVEAALRYFIHSTSSATKDMKKDRRIARKAGKKGSSGGSTGAVSKEGWNQSERSIIRSVENKQLVTELASRPELKAHLNSVKEFFRENDYELASAAHLGMALGIALTNPTKWEELVSTHVAGDESGADAE